VCPAPGSRRRSNLGAQQVDPNLFGFVAPAGLGGGKHGEGGVERARMHMSLRRCQRALRTACLVRRECCGALQEGGDGSEAAPTLGPAR
jgi:hypothetical protein